MLARSQNACVSEQIPVDLAHPLKGVKKDDEEDQHDRQRNLGLDAQAQPDGEKGGERDARDRIGRLDVRPQHVGKEAIAPKHHAEDDPKYYADCEADDGLL